MSILPKPLWRVKVERFVRVFSYAFIPLALTQFNSWIDVTSWQGKGYVSAAAAAIGVAYRVMFPSVVTDSVIVGRVDK